MAVEARYISTLDKEMKLFTSKAEADAHDKKIALVESLTDFIDRNYVAKNKPDETVIEEIAMILANHKDQVAKAMKGSVKALSEAEKPKETSSSKGAKEKAPAAEAA